jgi:hypothetical protein
VGQQCVVSGTLTSEEAKTYFVLPALREALAHFARRNTRSTDTEMGGSDDDNAHSRTKISTNLGVGFLPLRCEQGG